MVSGVKHKFEIGTMGDHFLEELRLLLNDSQDGFVSAWGKVDGVVSKQAILKVQDIESVIFE